MTPTIIILAAIVMWALLVFAGNDEDGDVYLAWAMPWVLVILALACLMYVAVFICTLGRLKLKMAVGNE